MSAKKIERDGVMMKLIPNYLYGINHKFEKINNITNENILIKYKEVLINEFGSNINSKL